VTELSELIIRLSDPFLLSAQLAITTRLSELNAEQSLDQRSHNDKDLLRSFEVAQKQ